MGGCHKQSSGNNHLISKTGISKLYWDSYTNTLPTKRGELEYELKSLLFTCSARLGGSGKDWKGSLLQGAKEIRIVLEGGE